MLDICPDMVRKEKIEGLKPTMLKGMNGPNGMREKSKILLWFRGHMLEILVVINIFVLIWTRSTKRLQRACIVLFTKRQQALKMQQEKNFDYI